MTQATMLDVLTFDHNVPENIRESFHKAQLLVPACDAWRTLYGKCRVILGGIGEPGVTGLTAKRDDGGQCDVHIDLNEVNRGESLGDYRRFTTLAPAGGMSLLDHTILHEWIHVVDLRPPTFEEFMGIDTAPTYPVALGFLSAYATWGGEREAWAEAGTEFFGTRGTTTNKVALWYADTAQWTVGQPNRAQGWPEGDKAWMEPGVVKRVIEESGNKALIDDYEERTRKC